jgi:hypothetical protein
LEDDELVIHIAAKHAHGDPRLLQVIELQKEGDLYVSHDPFLDIAMNRGLAVDGWTLAEISPVIIVHKGNPKNIRGLQDRPADVQLASPDPNASTLEAMLHHFRQGRWI